MSRKDIDVILDEMLLEMVDKEGFIKFINNFIDYVYENMCNGFNQIKYVISILNDVRGKVMERNKPEELDYFNEVLRNYTFKLMESVSIDLP